MGMVDMNDGKPRMLRIVEFENPVIGLEEEKFGRIKTPKEALEKLRRLREDFRLDEVVSGGETEFERILLLKRWVRSRWNHGWNNTKPPPDAYEILKHAERGETFTCGYYALVLSECYRSFGYQSRRLGIRVKDTEFPANPANFGHCVTEVWSNEFCKWVVMDADKNCYYEKDGVPLSALEIRDAWLNGEEEKVKQVFDEPRFVIPTRCEANPMLDDEEELKRQFFIFSQHKSMPYYHYIEVTENSLGKPKVRWTDRHSPPQLICNGKPHPQDAIYVDRKHDFNWQLNRVHIALECRRREAFDNQLSVRLTHSMPDFERFEAKIDAGPWKPVESEFTWHLKIGTNRLACRAVNIFGVKGPESYVVVEYKEW
ncbi:MAG: hypothetical protein AYL32_014030 [Candidatus Bathyarchaeota archaeon B26-2]|nr:MAG: hypothetical protein AYL32_014030 [Candidatus Bathyarchaeota archaeon B26-2]